MTKLRMRTLYAGPLGIYYPGDLLTVEEDVAAELVGGGFADQLESSASAPKVETAEAPPAPEKAARTGKPNPKKPA